MAIRTEKDIYETARKQTSKASTGLHEKSADGSKAMVVHGSRQERTSKAVVSHRESSVMSVSGGSAGHKGPSVRSGSIKGGSERVASVTTARMRDRITEDTLRKISKNKKIRINGKYAAWMVLRTGISTMRNAADGCTKDEPITIAPLSTHIQNVAQTVVDHKHLIINKNARYQKYAKKTLALGKKLDKSIGKYEKVSSKIDKLKQTGAEKDVRKLQRKLQRRENSVLKTAAKKQKYTNLLFGKNRKKGFVSWLKRAIRLAFASIVGAAAFLFIAILIFGIAIMLIAGGMQTSAASNSGALSGDAVIVYTYLKEKGLDDIHCAAIMGNIKQESSMNHLTIESNGEGIGLFQFSFSLKTAYYTWCSNHGISDPLDNIQAQLDFFWENDYSADRADDGQINFGWWTIGSRNRFESTSDLNKATLIFYDEYEGANIHGTDNTGDIRCQYALEYYAMMQNAGSLDVNADGEARLQALFPGGVPTTASGIAPYLGTCQVKLAGGGTASLTIHKALIPTVQAIFEEMARINFPINPAEIGGYSYRVMASGTGHLSHHSYGVAIDINWGANPAVYWDSSPDTSSPYYINQTIVNIWKKHGFFWGGDWDGGYYDPMHFTWTNH